MSLLLLHICTLVYFCIIWFQSISVGNTTAGRRLFLFSPLTTKELSGSKHQQLSPMYITSTLLTSNFIGICFSRTIHYQFYSWYFHALPFLLICPRIHSSLQPTQSMTPWWMVRAIVILVAVEIAYLTFPATPVSSAMLQIAHFAILIQIGPPEMVLAETSPSNNKLD
jgi:alpha-1,3-mannosyltransferase